MYYRILMAVIGLCCLVSAQAQQDIPQKNLKTNITKATVFLNGAQVLREGKITIPPGTTDILIEKLPVRLDPTSIQVKGDGDFTIMAVTPSRVDPPKVEFVVDQDKIDRLLEKQKALNTRLSYVKVSREAYDEEERLLDESRAKLTSHPEGGLSVDDIDRASNLYRKKFTELKKAQWDNTQVQARIATSIDSINKAITVIRTPVPIEKVQEKPSYQIKVTVSAKRSVPNADIEVSYLVAAAGWLPSYDIRIDEVGKPVYLGFRAQVYQATEEDWRDIKLVLSTGNPSRNSIKPSSQPWYLQYADNDEGYSFSTQAKGHYNPTVRRVSGKVVDENNAPLSFVPVLVKGTTVGTTTDDNGDYEILIPEGGEIIVYSFVGYKTTEFYISTNIMNVTMKPDAFELEEVVVMSRAAGVSVTDDSDYKQEIQLGNTIPLVVNRVQRATNQVYEIEAPYSLAGDGRRFSVDVQQYELPADYAYASFPKADGNAYLTARIPDWDAFSLMEGEARLFFEDAYLGKTLLETRTVVDTLVLSLGVDDAVVIEREKVRDESKSQLLGLTRKETRVFEIAVRNTKMQAVRVLVEDQVPVSRDKSINVKFEEAPGATYNEETGELTWDVSLKPGEVQRFRFRYVVKYPAEKTLFLE